MKLVRCTHGHFYDADKYSSCPHCESISTGTEPLRIEDRSSIPVGSWSNGTTDRQYETGEDVTESIPRDFVNYPSGSSSDNVNQRASGKADADDGEVTVPDWAIQFDDDHKVTASGFALVAGWLVCIEGPGYGRSYEIHPGRNTIGRNARNDISLSGDDSVSRSNHAVIIYEPRRRNYYVQSGDAHELAYCNGEVILGSRTLSDRDTISLGRSRLLFVPLCNASFDWGLGEAYGE